MCIYIYIYNMNNRIPLDDAFRLDDALRLCMRGPYYSSGGGLEGVYERPVTHQGSKLQQEMQPIYYAVRLSFELQSLSAQH